ncbi:short-chain collagen C4 [Octopus bimaculoides]|uniref:Short-chain collagen C4-like n=1 Tax=Octopus bimaculoides TaxID=37653 RepID=A0A0L8GIJ6_OCTBM|nr:short-chain collagen C4 [Octopus bimaculoides]|eukprot:XP_014780685.1 PREDICTED: short-chain collagen C4-like [Octopus bimaculoides]
MDFSQFSRNVSQRFSISSLVAFGLFLILTITILHQDSRIRKMEEKSEQNRFVSKKSLDDKPDDTPKPGLGSLYTRWGRTTCPPYSELVYDGVVGGQHYDQTGGGSNLLCLPNDPIWANYTTVVDVAAQIYGCEYEITVANIFSLANAKTLQDHNVPCAVCLTRQPDVVMMLPARTRCYPGWTIEYSGYLMTAHNDHKGREEYVCVDHAPEADPAGYRDENGALLYFVQGVCGSLPCPPYVNGQELSCVVCSKY